MSERQLWHPESVRPLARKLAVFGVFLFAVSSTACSDKKKAALEAIKRDVKEEGLCTLPVDVLGGLKQQLVTKSVCMKKGNARGAACFAALVANGLADPMPSSYMGAWPDEVASASLTDVPAYERRARSELFESCLAMKEGLREGKFSCASVEAEKVVDVEKTEKGKMRVTYKREITYKRDLAPLDAACGPIVRVPEEMSANLTKGEDGWKVDAPAP